MKRGRELAKAEMAEDRARLEGQHAGEIAGIKQAHQDELKRMAKLIGKAAFREGGLLGMVFGMGLSAALIAGTWWLAKDAVLTRTTYDRVQHSLEAGPVPSLNDSYRQLEPATGEPIRRAP